MGLLLQTRSAVHLPHTVVVLLNLPVTSGTRRATCSRTQFRVIPTALMLMNPFLEHLRSKSRGCFLILLVPLLLSESNKVHRKLQESVRSSACQWNERGSWNVSRSGEHIASFKTLSIGIAVYRMVG